MVGPALPSPADSGCNAQGHNATSTSYLSEGGTPAAPPERMPADADPGKEHGAQYLHRGLATPVHPDTLQDPISRLDIASK